MATAAGKPRWSGWPSAARAGARWGAARRQRVQSPRVSSEALPPAAVVLTVTVFSVAKRGR